MGARHHAPKPLHGHLHRPHHRRRSYLRRRKGKTLTPPRASSILRRFRQHLAARYTVIEVTPDLLDDAMRLGNAHALRAYDAVQLAVALEVNRSHQADGFGPITLISADQALNVAATAEGLSVEDPNSHP
jgi:uncharacterized protein